MRISIPRQPEIFRAGDILLFQGCDPESLFIRAATVPPWYWRALRWHPHWRDISHFAFIADWHGRSLLIESTTLCDEPCEITGKRIKGVQAHDPARRIADYHGPVWKAEPAPGWRLTNEQRSELTRFVYHQLGQPYDAKGAILSATRHPTTYREQMRFCSDVGVSALARCGLFPIDNPKRYTPSKLAGAIRRNGNFSIPRRLK